MRDPAAGGVDGPELPDLVVLEVGVDEGPQGWPLGAERARRRCGRGGERRSGLVAWSRVGPWTRVLLPGRHGPAAVGPHSLWRAAQGRRICGGEGTAMCRARYALDGRATGSSPCRRSRRVAAGHTAGCRRAPRGVRLRSKVSVVPDVRTRLRSTTSASPWSARRHLAPRRVMRRHHRAAIRFLRTWLKKQGGLPRRLITDQRRSSPAAHRTVTPSVLHRSQP